MFKEHANRYFAELENIYKKENISTRTKMLLLNLFELRGNNWFHRMRKERPVTIDQIRSQKGEILLTTPVRCLPFDVLLKTFLILLIFFI